MKQVYDYLEDSAKDGEVVTYGEIMDEEGIHRARIAYVLAAISTIEDDGSHLPLSAIVVNSGTKTPGTGFFGLSEELKNTPDDLEDWAEEEKHQWWESTVEEVHKFWSTQ
ncbi:hypothetical protein [Halobellus salinisoli]|uniref:hypothetical protein n=1 Tax=Halobellus salinisoli TaxID=3108500 RepID=UPI003009B43D